MVQLLRLNEKTVVNPNKIVQITIENLNRLRQERRQHHETPEQRERMKDEYWEVSVYFRSDSDGYNPQRYTQRFQTELQAKQWIKHKFGGVIVDHL